ncbi:MAG: glutamine amidotransferase-related protein, partial [Candidatus Ranarchaeia archaeon]
MVFIPVIFNGGQYNSLIALALEKAGAKTDILPNTSTRESFSDADGLVIGGGPYSLVNEIEKLGEIPNYIKTLDIPVLGLCLGHHLIGSMYGGKIGKAPGPEFGKIEIKIIDPESVLVKGLPEKFIVWGSHNDEVSVLPEGFHVVADSETCNVEIMEHDSKQIYGIQFHPEVSH